MTVAIPITVGGPGYQWHGNNEMVAATLLTLTISTPTYNWDLGIQHFTHLPGNKEHIIPGTDILKFFFPTPPVSVIACCLKGGKREKRKFKYRWPDFDEQYPLERKIEKENN